MKRFSVLGTWAVLGVVLCLALAGCSSNQNQSAEQTPGSDPAQSNLAAAASTAAQQAPVEQTAAPAQKAPAPQTYAQQSQPSTPNQYYDQNYAVGTDDTESGEQPVYTEQPPPPLPDYTQPECPGENYIWTPGYWAYASAGYYWVPGAWVLAPFVGALWTPPYWAYTDGRYRWYHGYWAPHIGFYGGINYGFGYVGRGYEGGYWNRDAFDYNRVVNNVNVNRIHNVYSYRVADFTNGKVSYDGGRGGLDVRPTGRELAVLHEQRIAPVRAQVQHRQQAATDRAQFDAVNHGRPQTFAAARPLATEYRAPAVHPAAVPGARVLPHVNNIRQEAQPTAQRPGERPAPNERPEARTNPMARTPEPRTEQRPAEQRQFEQRPAQQPQAQQRPAEQRQFEQRPAPQARQESRPAPQPRMEQRPTPEAHQEARPVPQPRAEQRPSPQPRAEERSMPQRPAAPARPEARPTPQPRSEERPAPQAHGEAHPAPHQESRPAPNKEEKREEHPH